MKHIKLFITAFMTTMILTVPAYAGTWLQDSTGWSYQEDHSPYTIRKCWRWIDGNHDGIAECYDFRPNGYMLSNTTTPDGYTVNENGAWTVDGVVQTKVLPSGDNIPTGYNENGLSNLAIDLLEHTRAENDAKYGEVKVIEEAGDYDAYYNGIDFRVEYDEPEGKPFYVSGVKTDIFKDAPMTGNAYKDRDALKDDGYSVTTNGEYVAVDCGKYLADIRDDGNVKAYIKFDYK